MNCELDDMKREINRSFARMREEMNWLLYPAAGARDAAVARLEDLAEGLEWTSQNLK